MTSAVYTAVRVPSARVGRLLAARDARERALQAQELSNALRTAQLLEQRFDALSPWLEQLVQETVSRIVGALPADERYRRIIAEALSTARPSGKLRLRVHPDDLAVASAAVETLGAPCPIAGDPALGPDGIILDCDGGLLDLSLSAQLSAVVEDLARALADGGAA